LESEHQHEGHAFAFHRRPAGHWDRDAVRRISVHDHLEITSPAPLHVHYVGAREPEHGRGTDKRYLNYLGGEHTWKQGEVISQYEAVIRPVAKGN